ncbi:MAG: helix-turn-helix domain-containing protein [Candidatus Woesearchaeota archaeon]|jgi:predicted transcriptional regulator
MYEELLLESGLTQNEIKVYLSLLKKGKSQSGILVQESKISSGKIYETLNKLLDKGLVEVTVENGVKQFQATNPKSLLMYMQERKEKIDLQTNKLEMILPELQKIRQMESSAEGVFLIKGVRGIKPLVYEVLSKARNEIKIMGVRSSKNKVYNTFWTHWHHERVKLHKKAKLLFADQGTPYWNFFKGLRLTEIRSITSLSPSAIMIIDEHCFLLSYDPEFTCIHIVSPAIAKSFDSFFESMWKIAQN